MPNGTSISTYAKSTQAHPASSGRGAATAHGLRVSGGSPSARKTPAGVSSSGRGVISIPQFGFAADAEIVSLFKEDARWNRHPRAI